MTWLTRSSRTVYENAWLRVREDEVTRPNGEPGIYGVVQTQNPAVFVVALTDDDEVVLVCLDRYTTGDPASIELPAGSTDGEDPLLAAQRELAEETGLTAEEWTPVGGMNALNGVALAPEFVYLARGLREIGSAAATQAEEGIAEVRRVPFGEVMTMVRGGIITDGETLAALLLAAVALGRVN